MMEVFCCADAFFRKTNMKVTNVNGTTQNACSCGSWLEHWKKFSGQSVTYCAVNTCIQKDIVGAHVQKEDSTDQSWYILPLCNSHNNEKAKSLEVGIVYQLVSANIAETCGKR